MAAAFEELGVMPELIKAVEELGWTLPTPVQVEAVPLILGGGDVMAAAETGSGKTGAFALPVLQIVHETLTGLARSAAVASAAAAHKGDASASSSASSSGRRCELSVDDRDAFFSIRDGVRCQCRQERNWGGARATLGAFGGRVYYEAEVCDEGLCRVGWSTLAASYDLGTDRHSFGYGGTGKKSHARQFDSYGDEYTKGDVVGCLLDTVQGTISFSKNGKVFEPAFQIPAFLQGQVLYPAICLKNAEMVINFGDTPFKFGPPPGFAGLAQAPADVTVSAAAAATAATAGSDGSERKPLCLVLELSRDLAEQTHKCFQLYGKHLTAPALSSVLLVGGVDAGPQFRALKEGAEIVVGTPGRVIDFVESGKLPLDKIRFFVLDEADRLLDSEDVIMKLFKRLPKGGAGLARLQVLMFSATLHSAEVKRLAAALCHQPLLVDLKGKDAVPDTVDHVLVRVDPTADATWLQSTPKAYTDNMHQQDALGPQVRTQECMSQAVKILKQRLLKRILDTLNMDQCLIFCRTNFDCDNLEKFMLGLGGDAAAGGGAFKGKREGGKEHPYSCVVLAGQRSMDERRRALQAFKDGDVRFLICTDVAARGIDISGLPYVINMTLPDKSEDYIHRVGRVGRADHMGLAISLVSTVPEKVWFCTIKGYKPWLEPDANNTKTQEQGGQTIWYDEPSLLQEVEKRLGASIPSLADDLSLPPELQARLAGEGSAYGQARGGGATAEVSERLESIRQNVETLVALEWQAQTSFLTLKGRWAGGGSGGGGAGGAGAGGGGAATPMEAC